MAIQKDVRIQFIEEKRGDALQQLETEIKDLNKNLTELKQNNLQLKKDFGASSQEFINGKKKEIQLISDIKNKTSELKSVNKQYSDELKKVTREITEEKKKESDAKKKFEKDFSDFVKRNEDIAVAYSKKASDQRKQIKKEEDDAKKKFEKDFSDFVKRNEDLAVADAKRKADEKKKIKKDELDAKKKFEKDFSDFVKRHQDEAYAHQVKVNQGLSTKLNNATYPEYLKQLQFELKLLGVEQLNLIRNGQRESAQFQNNKQKIQELTAEVKGLKREMQGLEAQQKLSKLQIMEYAENFMVVAFGIKQIVTGLFDMGRNAVMEGAKLKVLQDNFKGTREELELLRKASADTLEESQLIAIYNKATKQIKLTSDETARLLAYSEDLADDGIGDLVSNFNNFINAIITGGRGLNAMGISTKMFKDDLKATAQQMGINIGLIEDTNDEEEINISKLDAKTQRILVLKTLFDNGYIPSLENAKNKEKDAADKLEAVKVKMKEGESTAGQFIMRGLEPLTDSFLRMGKGGTVAVGALSGIMGYALMLIPIVGNLRLAFMGLGSTAVLSAIGAVGGKIAALLTPIGIVTAAVLALTNLLTRVQNLLKGRGFVGDPMNDLSDDNTARQKAIDSLSKYRKVNTKMGNISEKYLPDNITDEDIKLRMYELRNKDVMDADKRKYETEKKIQEDREQYQKNLDKGLKDGKDGSKTKDELLTLDKVISELDKQVKAAEEEYAIGKLTKEQRDAEYQLILKYLQSKKDLINVTKENLTEEQKSLEIRTNQLQYDQKELELQHKLGILTENERKELELKNNALEKSLSILDKTKYKVQDKSTSNIPTHKLTPEQAEIEARRLQDIENTTRQGQENEKNKIISSEDYKRAEFIFGQLGNFFERTMSNAWEGIFGKANNFATQFFEDLASQFLSMFANWGMRNLLNAIFPGAGIITSFFGGGRASGGDVNPGKYYMVGENGPEILAPRTNGTVIPNDVVSNILKNSASSQGPKIVYVEVPVFGTLKGRDLMLSYNRSKTYYDKIKI